MRAEVEYDGSIHKAPALWTARVRQAIDREMDPRELLRYGFTVELFAFCGVSLYDLLHRTISAWPLDVTSISDVHMRRYALEHLLDVFHWTIDDLRLLNFHIKDLIDKAHYPLIVLYQQCQMRASDVFAFDIGYNDLKKTLLDVDPRYAVLLRLNLPYWQRVLSVPLAAR